MYKNMSSKKHNKKHSVVIITPQIKGEDLVKLLSLQKERRSKNLISRGTDSFQLPRETGRQSH